MAAVALVTGVGPGTGKSIVERFAEAGYTVAMLARSQERLAQINQQRQMLTPSSATSPTMWRLPQRCRQVKESFGAPAIVVHNAVGAERGTYAEIDPQNMRRAFEINTMACCR